MDLENAVSMVRYFCGNSQATPQVTDEEVREWYAKERNCTIIEFDDYDLHVCRVINGFIKAHRDGKIKPKSKINKK
jgi:hypothetical protein